MSNTPRRWISAKYQKPQDGKEIYYFCKRLGIFKGEYHYLKSSYANPHKFSSLNGGVLDCDDVSYWMYYDHNYQDVIPLPPDYDKISLNHIKHMFDTEDNISVPLCTEKITAVIYQDKTT